MSTTRDTGVGIFLVILGIAEVAGGSAVGWGAWRVFEWFADALDAATLSDRVSFAAGLGVGILAFLAILACVLLLSRGGVTIYDGAREIIGRPR